MMTNEQMQVYADKVAVLNDKQRKSLRGYVITRGVVQLSIPTDGIIVRVRDFDDFNLQNDPYGEHDFGSFEITGIKIFWKIDYYDELCHILKKFETTHAQAEALQEWVTNEHDFWGEDAAIWTDLVHSALSRVDWLEIIENNR